MNVGAVTAYRIKCCCSALAAIGTKRTFAAPQQFVRYWTRADIDWVWRALKSAPMAVVAAAVVVAVVAAWVLRQLLRKSISTWSGSSWSTLVFTRHQTRPNHRPTIRRPVGFWMRV